MPGLIIDNQEIEVPKGTKVIDAAERLGIMIPRFCYHAGLGSVGACRMCAVVFKEGPVKGLDMSCMVEVEEGMVVSTTDPEAVSFRKWIIECLMLHHPHDCPVCDEGGHCLLQDETVSGGHGIRRYRGKKRTYSDQYLGEFVQHEMNRCIHCWRCRRFYQEFAGYRDLGALQIANRTYFGRFSQGSLESPFSGNIIDLCPTGVFTDKPSRYKGRRWDFERAPSLCIHCSLGCNTIGSARYREMIRIEARLNEEVNGHFICDRGRYGYQYANRPDRPRQARVGEKTVPWQQALKEGAEKLAHILRTDGSQAIASIGSLRCSLETQAQLVQVSRTLDWREPSFFMDSSVAAKTRRAVSRLDSRLAVSMREIEDADFILAVAADPINEAPMLALAMRQAFRKGAKTVVIDPRPLSLPLDFEHLNVPFRDMGLCLGALVKSSLSREELKGAGPQALAFYEALSDRYGSDPFMHDHLAHIGEELRKSRHPVVICGTDVAQDRIPEWAADCALLLRVANKEARLLYILPGPNAFGAALFSRSDASLAELTASIEKGEIKALLIVEADPFSAFPDQRRWVESLKKLDLLIVLDYLPTPSVAKAHVLLPTSTVFETDSHYMNHEGRIQKASTLYRGGIPIHQISRGSHPPRTFETNLPGGEVKPAAIALAEIGAAVSIDGGASFEEDLWSWLAQERTLFTGIPSLDPEDPGIRAIPEGNPERDFSSRIHDLTKGDSTQEKGLELLLVDWTFGTEELSSYSSHIEKGENRPHLVIHTKEASRLNLSVGDKIVLHLAGGPLEGEVRTAENMAHGVIVMPRHHQLTWQKAGAFMVEIPTHKIERI